MESKLFFMKTSQKLESIYLLVVDCEVSPNPPESSDQFTVQYFRIVECSAATQTARSTASADRLLIYPTLFYDEQSNLPIIVWNGGCCRRRRPQRQRTHQNGANKHSPRGNGNQQTSKSVVRRTIQSYR